ncbi:MAG: hypothetical protein F6K00_12595 [Leptolyngbya sp. SIOISBB]|nr:hypothetical protein [Leptolyngbya sp. SIOISBB]
MQIKGQAAYLAVPVNTYETFFTMSFIQNITQRYEMSLLLYQIEQEAIVQWIN